jgi:phage shock protein C
MYCSNCGKSMEADTRFCSACGIAFHPVAGYAYPRRRLVRPRAQRVIGGVCAAFALEYGWELSLTRIVAALLVVFTGVGLIVYLAAWIIIPDEPYLYPEVMAQPATPQPGSSGVSA